MRALDARIVGQGDEIASGQIPFTPRAKKVLELSLREGLALGHSYIGTEHVLPALARENEGVATRVLLEFGVDADRVRNDVMGMLGVDPQPSYVRHMEQRSGVPPVAVGAAVACGIGIFIGWAIWG